MNRAIITAGLMLVGAPGLFALQSPARATPSARNTTPARSTAVPSSRQQSLLARVTVYWASGGRGSDRWTRRHLTATSVRLRPGHCAVDPRRIPYGSRVCFPDTTLLAVDTGRHVVSRKAARLSGRTVSEKNAIVIDRFFETKGQALAWANSHPPFMNVQVIPPALRLPPPVILRAEFVNAPRQKLVADNRARGFSTRSVATLR